MNTIWKNADAWEGLKRTGKIYLLVILTLAIAAVYEVIEVVIMVKAGQ